MKRDNSLVKFTIFVLLITIVAVCLVSGTYAKYTSTVTGEAEAVVAKWTIEVNDNEITTDEDGKVTFNLFSTINDTDGATVETDVKTGLIAPGTSGNFAFKIDNLSEVNAEYTIELGIDNPSSVPLQFSTDGGQTWKDIITEVNITKQPIAMETGTKTVNVQWRWVFEGDHTHLGIEAQTEAPKVTVDATITVEQVD